MGTQNPVLWSMSEIGMLRQLPQPALSLGTGHVRVVSAVPKCPEEKEKDNSQG
jgi:hypothetical protein